MSLSQTPPDLALDQVAESSHPARLQAAQADSSLLITITLALALIPSVFLLYVNGQEAFHRLGPFKSLKSASDSRESHANASSSLASTNRPSQSAIANRPVVADGGSGSNKMTNALYLSQLSASVCNLVNQILFLVLHVTPASALLFTYEKAPSAFILANGSKSPQYSTLGCSLWTGIADTFYLLFQPLATMILIWRATGVVPRWTATPQPMGWLITRSGARTLLTCAFVAGLLPVTASVFLRTIQIDYTYNKCDVQYPLALNNAGKLVFFAVYAALGAVFSIPLLRHLRSMRKYASPASAAGNAEIGAAPMIVRVLRDVGFRIVVAVITYLVTAIAVLAGGFSARGAMSVAFTLQNLSALLAATFAVRSREYDSSRTGSASRSAGASTSGRGGGDEEAMRSQSLLESDSELSQSRSVGWFSGGRGGSVRSQTGTSLSHDAATLEMVPVEFSLGLVPTAKAAESHGHHLSTTTAPPAAPRPVARSVMGRAAATRGGL